MLEGVYTPQLDAYVCLRPGTSDRQVWADTFTGLYHVPPRWMPEPRTVLDAGSNIGLTAAHYAHMWPSAKVVAVELDAGNAEAAWRNFQGEVVVAAVAGEDARRSYELGGPTDAYALGAGATTVEARRLGSLIDEYLDGFCDFLKLDIEGAEWEVFADDGWRDHVARLLVELHPYDDHPDEDNQLVIAAVAALDALGYETLRHWQHPRALYAIQRF